MRSIIALLTMLLVTTAYGQMYDSIGDDNLEPINPGLYDEQPNSTGQFDAGRIGTYPEPRGSLGLTPRPRSSSPRPALSR